MHTTPGTLTSIRLRNLTIFVFLYGVSCDETAVGKLGLPAKGVVALVVTEVVVVAAAARVVAVQAHVFPLPHHLSGGRGASTPSP